MDGECSLSTFFFFTKKNPAPSREEKGRIMPAAKDSWIYFSMASLSGRNRLNRRLEGKRVPGRRSIAQCVHNVDGEREVREGDLLWKSQPV